MVRALLRCLVFILFLCLTHIAAFGYSRDSTPLFYAALCGRVEVARLLLRYGASCEKGTFDGERCLYAALDDETRRLLEEEGFARGGAAAHDAFMDFLENAFDNEADGAASWRDVELRVGGEARGGVRAHACVLAARLPGLLERAWPRRDDAGVAVFAGARFCHATLSAVVRWAYTARLEVASHLVGEAAALLRSSGQPAVAAALEGEDASTDWKRRAGRGTAAVAPPLAEAKAELAADLLRLIGEEGDVAEEPEESGSQTPQSRRALALVRRLRTRFAVGGRVFFAHPLLLAPRSAFFDALLTRWSSPSPHLHAVLQSESEIDASDRKPVEIADVSSDAFHLLLTWAATDAVPPSAPRDVLLDLLSLADRCLLDGLKARAALALVPHVSRDTCVFFLSLAEASDVPRLGAAAATCVAEHLECLPAGDEGALAAAAASSASSVRGRHAADSIPLLDDVAYEVARLHGRGELSDSDEEQRWRPAPLGTWAPAEAGGGGGGAMRPADARRAAAADARRGAASARRRKAAILEQLAAGVQGWETASARA